MGSRDSWQQATENPPWAGRKQRKAKVEGSLRIEKHNAEITFSVGLHWETLEAFHGSRYPGPPSARSVSE